jgi:hypothetical protein
MTRSNACRPADSRHYETMLKRHDSQLLLRIFSGYKRLAVTRTVGKKDRCLTNNCFELAICPAWLRRKNFF